MKKCKLKKSIETTVSIAAILITIVGCSADEPATDVVDVAVTTAPTYVGGYPTQATVDASFEKYDYQAATQFYVWSTGYLNTIGFSDGLAKFGGTEDSMYIFDKQVGSQHKLLTANSEAVYNWSQIISVKDSPVVVVVPPKASGQFWDSGTRALGDFGFLGNDFGAGGKYLIVDRNWDGELPEDFRLIRVKESDYFMFQGRSFPVIEGSLEGAVKKGKQISFHRLSDEVNGAVPAQDYQYIGDAPFSQLWAEDAGAFEIMANHFNKDTAPEAARAHLGNMRALGMKQGEAFNPNAEQSEILERAAETGLAMVKSMAFGTRTNDTSKFVYDNRQHTVLNANVGKDFYQGNYEEVEARAGGWYQLVTNYMFDMTKQEVGKGQFYVTTYKDSDGEYLQGGNTYQLTMPADVPVNNFWSVPVYDLTYRAMIENGSDKFSLKSTNDLVAEADGSFVLYFAPELPEGAHEANWVKTNVGEGWMTIPRLYGARQEILDHEWRMNDFVRLNK